MNSLNRDWEKDFANLNFTYTDDYGNDALLEGGVEVVHNFIRTLIEEAKADERRRCLVDIKKKLPFIYAIGFEHADRNMIRNQALQECHDVLDQAISAISNKDIK